MNTKSKIIFSIAIYLIVGIIISTLVAETQNIVFAFVGFIWFAICAYRLKKIKCPSCGSPAISTSGLLFSKKNNHCRQCNADFTRV